MRRGNSARNPPSIDRRTANVATAGAQPKPKASEKGSHKGSKKARRQPKPKPLRKAAKRQKPK